MRPYDAVVSLIDVPKRLRTVDPKKVSSIADSIKVVGLLSPIILYSPDDETLGLVAGAHRLAAVKSLGWETVPASLIEDEGGLFAQLVEIDENLMRSELTATEYAEHMQRRKEIWEAMQIQVESEVPPENDIGYKQPPEQIKKFASETANATGQSRQHVNRATRRAREVCQQARDLIRGTKLDTGAFLDSLIKQGLSDEAQVALVNEKLEALADEQRRRDLAEEEQARKEAAKRQREDARRELVNFLFEKLTAQEWQYVIEKLEVSGVTIKAATLRDWAA